MGNRKDIEFESYVAFPRAKGEDLIFDILEEVEESLYNGSDTPIVFAQFIGDTTDVKKSSSVMCMTNFPCENRDLLLIIIMRGLNAVAPELYKKVLEISKIRALADRAVDATHSVNMVELLSSYSTALNKCRDELERGGVVADSVFVTMMGRHGVEIKTNLDYESHETAGLYVSLILSALEELTGVDLKSVLNL